MPVLSSVLTKILIRIEDKIEFKCNLIKTVPSKMPYERQKYCNIVGCMYKDGTPQTNESVIMFR